MRVCVTKKHLKYGQPKFGLCPLSLSFQEYLNLPDYCIEAWKTVLVLKDFKGGFRYSVKYPEKVIKFNQDYFNHFLYNRPRKIPKPISFDIGWVYSNIGDYYDIDMVDFISYQINNWDGFGYYEYFQEKIKV